MPAWRVAGHHIDAVPREISRSNAPKRGLGPREMNTMMKLNRPTQSPQTWFNPGSGGRGKALVWLTEGVGLFRYYRRCTPYVSNGNDFGRILIQRYCKRGQISLTRFVIPALQMITRRISARFLPVSGV